MDRKEFQAIAEAIKDIPDDVKAWEQACDLIQKVFKIKTDAVSRCESKSDYIRFVYLRAYNIEQITHVMATVPVYLLVRNVTADTQMIITLFNEEQAIPFIPIFFEEKQARKELEYIDIPKEIADVVRIPLFMLIDGNFGFFQDYKDAPPLALFDDREDKPVIYFDRYQALSMLVDSTKTLRSRLETDIGICVVQRKPTQEEDYADQASSEWPISPSHNVKKVPVS